VIEGKLIPANPNAVEVSVYLVGVDEDDRCLVGHCAVPRTKEEWSELWHNIADQIVKGVFNGQWTTPCDASVLVEVFPCLTAKALDESISLDSVAVTEFNPHLTKE